MTDFYEQLLEYDLNPYFVFNSNGRIKSFNKEAEFLFNFVSIKELFEIAITHASKSYGFEKKFINIQYKKQKFYAILVAYVNDDEIALRLYKEVSQIKKINIDKNYQLCNIYTLINLSKNTSLVNSPLKTEEVFDVSIPELKININKFLIILNSVFTYFTNNENLKLTVYLKTGEYEIINEKKYYIVCLEFLSNKEIVLDSINLNTNTTVNIFSKNNKLELEIPLLT